MFGCLCVASRGSCTPWLRESVLGNCSSLLLAPLMICLIIASEILLLPAYGATSLTIRFFFCVCFSPLTKPLPLPYCQLPLLPNSSPPEPRPPFCFPSSFFRLFIHHCCFAAQLGPTFSASPRLHSHSGPCDDCVLYQSVTCVLAQPPPVPCTRRADPCAAAASTDRRAA